MQRDLEETAELGNGISLCYDTFGTATDPTMLLVMGLGGPLTWWHQGLCEMLADRGFFVVRYDNRDVGRSTKLGGEGGRRSDLMRAFVGRRVVPPYTLSDLAADGVALLGHLHVDRAHVVGVSMGGMIAQTMAIEHPGRVQSLVSIMSTTGRRSVGWQDPRLLPNLLGREAHDREHAIDQSMKIWASIGSPGYPTPTEVTRVRAVETLDRGANPPGVVRQMQAVLTQPDRTRALHDLTVPALVIHGLSDRMVHVSGGRATAQAIPDAELLLVPGMGHDLPTPLWSVFVDAIQRTAQRATRRSSQGGAQRCRRALARFASCGRFGMAHDIDGDFDHPASRGAPAASARPAPGHCSQFACPGAGGAGTEGGWMM